MYDVLAFLCFFVPLMALFIRYTIIPLLQKLINLCWKIQRGAKYFKGYRIGLPFQKNWIIHVSVIEHLQKELEKAQHIIEFQQNVHVKRERSGQLALDFALPTRNGNRTSIEMPVYFDGKVSKPTFFKHSWYEGQGLWSISLDQLNKVNNGKVYVKRGKANMWVNEEDIQKGDVELSLDWKLEEMLDYYEEEVMS